MSPIDDKKGIEVEFSEPFDRWLLRLRDRQAAVRIADRLLRLAKGHWGDVKPVGEGVSELRVACGPGYRLYVFNRNETWVVMLGGGDKSSQRRDIEEARKLARSYRDAD